MNTPKLIASVKYFNGFNSNKKYSYGAIFINPFTGEEKRKEYKTYAARKGAVTKFFNKMNRIYG